MPDLAALDLPTWFIPVIVGAYGLVLGAPVVHATAFPAAVDQIADELPQVPRQPRRRPLQSDSNRSDAPLVFIETAAEKLQPAAVIVDDEPSRRRTPRIRKPRDTASEPLVFVETQQVGNPDQTTL